jgi:hypothetical protein
MIPNFNKLTSDRLFEYPLDVYYAQITTLIQMKVALPLMTVLNPLLPEEGCREGVY